MKFFGSGSIAALLICSALTSPAGAPPPARFLGTFEIGKHLLLPTKANLDAASAEIRKSGCDQTVRVLALVDNTFSAASLSPAGWRLVAQVNNVATLEGCRHTKPFLTAIPGILSVEYRTRLFPSMDSARSETHINEVQGYAPSGLSRHFTGKGVLLGILDTEFDTHHPAFLDSLGRTRFIGIWDQSAKSTLRQNRFGYGVIRFQQDLQNDTNFGLGGDSHGTTTASMAAGSDKKFGYWGAAPEASIIGVKYGDGPSDLIDGLHWIFSIADSLKMPCVVNMSIGIQEGPHDGTSLTDITIDTLSGLSPVTGLSHIVVGAAGNDGLNKVHIAFNLAAGQAKGTWVWSADNWDSLAPGKGKYIAYSLADVWGEPNKPFSDTLCILDNDSGTFKKSGTAITTNRNSQSLDTLLWPNPIKGPDTLIIETLVERANAMNLKPHMEIYVFSSNWALIPGLMITSNSACTVHAWNAYKLNMWGVGMPGFYDGDTLMTINEIGGTAPKNIAVGSYHSKAVVPIYDGTHQGQADSALFQWAAWSSIGPTVDGRIKPDICAPGRMVVGAIARNVTDNSRTVVWPSQSSPQGRYSWSQGTSLSAPIVAGIVALMLQVNPKLTPDTVKSILQRTAINDKFTGKISPPYDVRWGAGKVNALGAIEALGVPVSSVVPGGIVAAGPGRVYASLRGRNLLQVYGTAASEQAVVEIYDLQGHLQVSLAATGSRPVAIPRSLATGCFVARVKVGRASGAPQTFFRM